MFCAYYITKLLFVDCSIALPASNTYLEVEPFAPSITAILCLDWKQALYLHRPKEKRKNKKQKIVYVKMSLTPSRNNGFQNMLKLGEPARDRSTYFIS